MQFNVLGKWDKTGNPEYITGYDAIDPELIKRIRTSLPEQKPVPIYNPHYLNNNNRNVIIRTDNPDFAGADIWITFIDEGAGYKNAVGYYVYDLQDGYDTPVYDGIPLTYETLLAYEKKGANILNKTIVFPNASLPGSGGNLKPGSTVRLVYDIKNPDKKFPNNVGVGFFLVPNGWNASKLAVIPTLASVHSDTLFNEKGLTQTVLFADLMKYDEQTGSMILGFEDIMRTMRSDEDFNDCIIKITYTPNYIVNTIDSLILSNVDEVKEDKLIADKTGLYFQFTASSLKKLMGTKDNYFNCEHKIMIKDDVMRKYLFAIFENILWTHETKLYIEDVYICVHFVINKEDLKQYIYWMRSIDNKTQESIHDPEIRNIVYFQNDYIFNNLKIVNQEFIKINDESDTITYVAYNGQPDTSNMITPNAMGDPHITTIYKHKYKLPNDEKVYQFYNDNELIINCKISKHPQNIDHSIYKDLTFMQYLSVSLNNDHIVFDMFNNNTFYKVINTELVRSEIPSWIKKLNINEYTNEINQRIAKYEKELGKYNAEYYSFRTKKLGKVIIEIVYVLHLGDYINDFSILSSGLLFNDAKGALISPHNVNAINNSITV